MKENLVKKLDLGNNHRLEIHDTSRLIAADTFLVSMEARLSVTIVDALFSPESLAFASGDEIRRELGKSDTYEYRAEQNFISEHEKERIFDRMLLAFEKNTLPYLSRPDFPEKFILKRYRECVAGR